MFDRLKNSLGFFADCIRLVAWAKSNKPLPPTTIEIELNFLAGYSQCFEVTETPNAIEYQGKIFVVASEDRETYQELLPVPLHWIDADFERINRMEHFKQEYMTDNSKSINPQSDTKPNTLGVVNAYLRAIDRPQIDSLDPAFW